MTDKKKVPVKVRLDHMTVVFAATPGATSTPLVSMVPCCWFSQPSATADRIALSAECVFLRAAVRFCLWEHRSGFLRDCRSSEKSFISGHLRIISEDLLKRFWVLEGEVSTLSLNSAPVHRSSTDWLLECGCGGRAEACDWSFELRCWCFSPQTPGTPSGVSVPPARDL